MCVRVAQQQRCRRAHQRRDDVTDCELSSTQSSVCVRGDTLLSEHKAISLNRVAPICPRPESMLLSRHDEHRSGYEYFTVRLHLFLV